MLDTMFNGATSLEQRAACLRTARPAQLIARTEAKLLHPFTMKTAYL